MEDRESEMRIIIAGSRKFNDYELLSKEVISFCGGNKAMVTIIDGGASGADALGTKFAREHDLPKIKKEAYWDHYGKAAGYIRNKEMAKIATHLIIFWDGFSKGSKHMIDLANSYGLIVKIVRY
jgi:hypothetical protein